MFVMCEADLVLHGTKLQCLRRCLCVPQNMPRAGAPRFEAGSSYTRDFGELGADPMSHCAASGSEMTLSATTRPLNEGTSRACHQIPGYTGFIPASHMNAVAQQQGEGLLTRTDLKVWPVI